MARGFRGFNRGERKSSVYIIKDGVVLRDDLLIAYASQNVKWNSAESFGNDVFGVMKTSTKTVSSYDTVSASILQNTFTLAPELAGATCVIKYVIGCEGNMNKHQKMYIDGHDIDTTLSTEIETYKFVITEPTWGTTFRIAFDAGAIMGGTGTITAKAYYGIKDLIIE